MDAPKTDPNGPLLGGSPLPGPLGAGGPGSPDNSFMCIETPGTTGVNDAGSRGLCGEYDPTPTANCVSTSAVPFPRPSALQAIRSHEGYRTFMYLDRKSFITIGVGWNLMSTGDSATPPAAAASLPWLLSATHQPPADPAASLQAAWSALRKISPFGRAQPHESDWFADKTDIFVDDSTPQNALNARFQKHISESTFELHKIFPDFNSYPVPAREALLDMVLMGSGLEAKDAVAADPEHHIAAQAGHKATGLRAFADLRAACAQHDWNAAADACTRKDVAKVRNDWTRRLFLEAAGWECADAG